MTRVAMDNAATLAGAPNEIDDRRFALAAEAARAERANRPRHLILLAAVLLFAALLALLVSWRSRAAAVRDLDGARAQSLQFVDLAGRLNAARAAGEGAEVKPGEPVEQLLSKIQNAGTSAGMESPPPLPIQRRQPPIRPGVARNQVTVNRVSDPSLEALIRWTELCTQEIPGLEIHTIKIRPEKDRWSMDVVFTRWEREGS